MAKYCGGRDFGRLYYNFISNDVTGKIFMMDTYSSDSIKVGQGATILLHKANPYLLHIVMDWYLERKYGIIGDFKTLVKIIEKNEKRHTKKRITSAKKRHKSTFKMMMQLHNILRKQQNIIREKTNTSLKKA